VCNAPVKPNITFFGEAMPQKFHWAHDMIRNKPDNYWKLSEEEKKKPLFENGGCDLMIVAGTALAVHPFSATLLQTEKNTPKVLINMENLRHNGADFEDLYNFPERLYLGGKCDETIWKIAKDVGWHEDLKALVDKKKESK
jgi:NAD-dependent SIR2 family protein deacetylase